MIGWKRLVFSVSRCPNSGRSPAWRTLGPHVGGPVMKRVRSRECVSFMSVGSPRFEMWWRTHYPKKRSDQFRNRADFSPGEGRR
jgi:hypothetical protein